MSNELAIVDRTADDLVNQVNLILEVMDKLMQKGQHYGKIPGTPKPTLFQPGAQKLCLTFRLVPRYEIQTINLEGGHREYLVTCTLTHQPTGGFAGQGVGAGSTMEAKYIKRAPADVCNTVLKMAAKRAYVAATLGATGASDIFTQDVEDGDAAHKNKYTTITAEPPKAGVQDIQELEGELKEVWQKNSKDGERWTYGIINGVRFSTKRVELGKAILDAQAKRVRVRIKKMVLEGGKIAFRPEQIEILPYSPTDSEISEQTTIDNEDNDSENTD